MADEPTEAFEPTQAYVEGVHPPPNFPGQWPDPYANWIGWENQHPAMDPYAVAPPRPPLKPRMVHWQKVVLTVLALVALALLAANIAVMVVQS